MLLLDGETQATRAYPPPTQDDERSRNGQATPLDDPCVVARDESGPARASAFSKASATASETVALSSTCRSALS